MRILILMLVLTCSSCGLLIDIGQEVNFGKSREFTINTVDQIPLKVKLRPDKNPLRKKLPYCTCTYTVTNTGNKDFKRNTLRDTVINSTPIKINQRAFLDFDITLKTKQKVSQILPDIDAGYTSHEKTVRVRNRSKRRCGDFTAAGISYR